MVSSSKTLEQTVHQAIALADERCHEYATLEHLLLALLEDPDAISVFRENSVDIHFLRKQLIEYLEEKHHTHFVDGQDTAKPTESLQYIIEKANYSADKRRTKESEARELLKICIDNEDKFRAQFLKMYNFSKFNFGKNYPQSKYIENTKKWISTNQKTTKEKIINLFIFILSAVISAFIAYYFAYYFGAYLIKTLLTWDIFIRLTNSDYINFIISMIISSGFIILVYFGIKKLDEKYRVYSLYICAWILWANTNIIYCKPIVRALRAYFIFLKPVPHELDPAIMANFSMIIGFYLIRAIFVNRIQPRGYQNIIPIIGFLSANGRYIKDDPGLNEVILKYFGVNYDSFEALTVFGVSGVAIALWIIRLASAKWIFFVPSVSMEYSKNDVVPHGGPKKESFLLKVFRNIYLRKILLFHVILGAYGGLWGATLGATSIILKVN